MPRFVRSVPPMRLAPYRKTLCVSGIQPAVQSGVKGFVRGMMLEEGRGNK